MDTLLVTGGAGFIGSNFVRHALADGVRRVVVLDALTYAGSRENLSDLERDERLLFVEGDIADRPLVARLLSEHQPAAVVNFAAETHVDRSIDSPRPFVATNIVGTFELLEACRAHRSPLRFLHVSTDEVYGSLGPTGLFREDTPYAPSSPYAASKASADHLVHAYFTTYGLPVLLTNCSNNYGPYQFPEKLIPLMTLNALDGRALPIYGDGGNVRDWLYVADHCAGLMVVLRRGRPGERYNLGGGAERTNVQIVDKICEILESLAPAAANAALAARGVTAYHQLKEFVADRKGHDRRYAIDASKIERELGWRPQHDFGAGLAATVRWYLEHRSWCEQIQARGQYRRERLGLG